MNATRNERGQFLKGITPANKTHNMDGSPFYNVFLGITQRCNNPDNQAYANYGGRGIKREWDNFMEFKADMYESYLEHCKEYGARKTQIDRRDNDGNYSKVNCRWVTPLANQQNRRNNRHITFNGETHVMFEWARIIGISPKLLHWRLKSWPLEKALNGKKYKNQHHESI